jgi:hypothetical protein
MDRRFLGGNRWGALRAAGTLALTATLGGCFSPDLSGAECVACPDDVCPGNLECRQGYCVAPGSRTTCSSEGDGGRAGSGGAGTAGNGAAATSGEGSGGSGNAAGGSGSDNAGAAGDGTGDSSTSGSESGLELTLSVPDVSCTGAALSGASAAATHGKPPYTFSIVKGPPGLSFVKTSEGVDLKGTFTDVGSYDLELRVTDAGGNHADKTATLQVHQTPVVVTTDLGDVCPNEVYSAKLVASGGDPKSYSWSVPEDFEKATGLEPNGSRLEGVFQNPSGKADKLDVALTVKSGGCSSATVPARLTVNPTSDKYCPHIQPTDALRALPTPCAHQDYAAFFEVANGKSTSYEWEELALPPGMDFDAKNASLGGVPSAGGTVTLQLTTDDRVVRQSFTVDPPREACWLAFLAPATGPTRLHLLDPLITSHTDQFPHGSQPNPVLDFKFSPDGRFLAYRSGADAQSVQLFIVDLLSPAPYAEYAVELSSVSHYAWANDYPALAISFDNDQGHFVGGVKLSGGGGSASPLTFSMIEPLTLDPAHAETGVASELTWFAGSSNIAFLAKQPEGDYRELMTGALGTQHDELTLHADNSYADLTVRVVGGSDGVFVVPDTWFISTFFGTNGAVARHQNVRIEPAGNYSARSKNDVLQVFGPTDDASDDTGTPRSTADACTAFLGWATGVDRLACARTTSMAPGPDHADIVVFDVKNDAAATLSSFTLGGNYVFPSSGVTNLPRLFSPSGKYYAYATGYSVYATSAPLAPGNANLDYMSYYLDGSAAGSDTVLAFSPDERFVLAHRGQGLTLFYLNADSQNGLAVGSSLPLAPGCTEDVRTPAGDYCGEPREGTSFGWSADSAMIAMGHEDGTLSVIDVRFVADLKTTSNPFDVTTECGSSCLNGIEFAFQPTINKQNQ